MGAVAPSFERQTVMGAERSHPNHGVVLVFLFGGILVGYVGLAVLEWTIGGPPADTAAIAWALYVAIVGGVGLGGYVYAARQFDALTIDRW
jgi:drug/metabolite transporter (DMT)-like permease